MNTEYLWDLVERARDEVADTTDAAAVAARASVLLAARPVAEIVATQQPLWDLLAVSYRSRLWAAAYLIKGGCSDDCFDYFRGWLIAQGREVFERVVADPDRLADLPAVIAAAKDGTDDFQGEDVLDVVWEAHQSATGTELPAESFTISLPELEDNDWDFDDETEMRRRLPRLTELFLG